jgi:hypothetical protein
VLQSVLGHFVSYNKTSRNNSLLAVISIFMVIYKTAKEMLKLDVLRN